MIKIIAIRGGIGNQMFCYAFFLALRKKYPLSFIDVDIFTSASDHNGFELSRIFCGIKIKKWRYYRRISKIHSVFFSKRFFHNINEEKSGTFQIIKKSFYPLIVFNGFWQTEKYFKHIKEKVKEKFKFDLNLLSKKSLKILDSILENNSVSIHIRRGDYLNHIENFGSICNLEYYINAVDYLNSIEKGLKFYIFSDDISWTQKHLDINNSFYVDFNNAYDSWQDMCLMSNCKHNIIANSTFSWWSAWLNNNKKKVVIAPKKWMNTNECLDIIPNDWIRI